MSCKHIRESIAYHKTLRIVIKHELKLTIGQFLAGDLKIAYSFFLPFKMCAARLGSTLDSGCTYHSLKIVRSGASDCLFMASFYIAVPLSIMWVFNLYSRAVKPLLFPLLPFSLNIYIYIWASFWNITGSFEIREGPQIDAKHVPHILTAQQAALFYSVLRSKHNLNYTYIMSKCLH